MKHLNRLILALVCLLLCVNFAHAQVAADLSTVGRAAFISRDGNNLYLGTEGADNIVFVQNDVATLTLNGSTGGLSFSNPTISGNLTFSSAAAKIIPGATSLTFRNNADNADNLAITNAGAATIRAGLTVTAGGATITAGDVTVSSGKVTIPTGNNGYFWGATSADSDVTGSIGNPPQYFLNNYATGGFLGNVGIGANTAGPVLAMFKTRSTTGDANTIVNNGDKILQLIGYMADGASYRQAAEIRMTVDAAPGSSDSPGAIDLLVSPDGSSTVASAFKVSNDKTATFTGNPVLSTAGTNVRLAAYVPTMAATPVVGTNQILPGLNVIPTAAANTAAILGSTTTPIPGEQYRVVNSGPNSVFIKAGGGATMNGAQAGGKITLATLASVNCMATSATNYNCEQPVIPTPQAP